MIMIAPQPVVQQINNREWLIKQDYTRATSFGTFTRKASDEDTTDFASVPKLFWNIIPPFGMWGGAAVIHDMLYKKCGIYGGQKFIKGECDLIFKEIMEQDGVAGWRITIMYSAVRFFGTWPC